MRSSNIIARWRRLGRRRQLLLVEATAAVSVASAAVQLMPFKRAVRWGSRRLCATGPDDVEAEVLWAVQVVAREAPWRAVCFQQGLAVQWMLRRRGVDASLHYGLARDDTGELEAHVWVAAGKRIIIGGAAAYRFHCVAIFP